MKPEIVLCKTKLTHRINCLEEGTQTDCHHATVGSNDDRMFWMINEEDQKNGMQGDEYDVECVTPTTTARGVGCMKGFSLIQISCMEIFELYCKHASEDTLYGCQSTYHVPKFPKFRNCWHDLLRHTVERPHKHRNFHHYHADVRSVSKKWFQTLTKRADCPPMEVAHPGGFGAPVSAIQTTLFLAPPQRTSLLVGVPKRCRPPGQKGWPMRIGKRQPWEIRITPDEIPSLDSPARY